MKRLMDLTLCLVLLVLTGPLMLGAALAVRLSMGPGVFFRQQRPGLHGTPFHLLKFRTMRHPEPGREAPAFDAERMTRVGRFLRRSSLDELPELFNVLGGDMSLVGPRPLLMQYLSRYTPRQARRMEVRPGITGLAQVQGRNALTWEERFELDVWYVDNRSLGLDVKILARTLGSVLAGLFSGRGVSQEGRATMTEFMGSDTQDTEDREKRHGVEDHRPGRG